MRLGDQSVDGDAKDDGDRIGAGHLPPPGDYTTGLTVAAGRSPQVAPIRHLDGQGVGDADIGQKLLQQLREMPE